MKKLILLLLTVCTALSAKAATVEIYNYTPDVALYVHVTHIGSSQEDSFMVLEKDKKILENVAEVKVKADILGYQYVRWNFENNLDQKIRLSYWGSYIRGVTLSEEDNLK